MVQAGCKATCQAATPMTEQVRTHIRNHGSLSSDDLKLDGDFAWQSVIHWSSGNNPSRSVLEQMYATGELIIHHKRGTRKYYDMAEKYIQPNLLNASESLESELEHLGIESGAAQRSIPPTAERS